MDWLECGAAFKVYNSAEFESTLTRQYFNQHHYKSFQRQLNLYSFYRIRQGPKKGGYFHPFFIRGMPELCKFVVRTPIRRKKLLSEHEMKNTCWRMQLPEEGTQTSEKSFVSTILPAVEQIFPSSCSGVANQIVDSPKQEDKKSQFDGTTSTDLTASSREFDSTNISGDNLFASVKHENQLSVSRENYFTATSCLNGYQGVKTSGQDIECLESDGHCKQSIFDGIPHESFLGYSGEIDEMSITSRILIRTCQLENQWPMSTETSHFCSTGSTGHHEFPEDVFRTNASPEINATQSIEVYF